MIFIDACDNNYGDIMADAFKNALGSGFSDYQFLGYPTDNFGIGTSYNAERKDVQLCAMWSCFGYTQDQLDKLIDDAAQSGSPTSKKSAEKLMDLDGYAAVGTGGAINLTTDQQSSVAVNAVVPSIYNMLSVNAGTDWQKHVKLSLSVPQAHVRYLNADSFATYMNSPGTSAQRRQLLQQGELLVVWSDLVADSMIVTIDVDTSADAALDASLTNALSGKAGTAIGKGADLTFKVNSATSGHYELQTLFPVIAAVQVVKPPVSNKFALVEKITPPDFRHWKRVKLDLQKLNVGK